MSKSGSEPISGVSRLAQTLCILGGGRVIECMRTHGVASRVIQIINNHPELEIKCDNSIEALGYRANGFKQRSYCELFGFATAAIDGIAIKIKCPKMKKVTEAMLTMSNDDNDALIAEVDEDGRLISDEWQRYLPTREILVTNKKRIPINPLRVAITNRIEDNNFIRDRAHD